MSESDLEWLLNSRSYPSEGATELEEVRKSVVAYGLPDFTGISVRNHNEMTRISKEIEEAISYFEPRLLDVNVKMESIENTDREIRFTVEAFLNVEPTPEPIVFDTVLELGSGDFSIRES